MKTAFRTLTTISAMSIVLLLANCSKEDDPGPDDVIIGNWQIATAGFTPTVNAQSLVDYFTSQGMLAGEALDWFGQVVGDYVQIDGNLDIKKGGTYSSTSLGSTTNGTWELSSDRKTLTLANDTGDEWALTVTTLTASNLNISGERTAAESGFSVTLLVEIGLTR